MLKLFRYQIRMSYTFWKSVVMLLAGQTLDFHVSVFFASKFDKSYSNTHSWHCSAVFQFQIQRGMQQVRSAERHRITEKLVRRDPWRWCSPTSALKQMVTNTRSSQPSPCLTKSWKALGQILQHLRVTCTSTALWPRSDRIKTAPPSHYHLVLNTKGNKQPWTAYLLSYK